MHPIELPRPAQPIAYPSGPSEAPPAAPSASFRELMAQRSQAGPTPARGGPGPLRQVEGTGLSGELTDVISAVRRDERRLDRYVRRALAGQDFELPQLVAMQSLAFRYSQRVELLSKLVDRVTSALKQTLQTQI